MDGLDSDSHNFKNDVMNSFRLNESGIHVQDKTFKVDYPTTGNEDSLSFEEESFWFRHRNIVICRVLKKNHLRGNFVDIGGANGLQAKFIQNNFPEREIAMVEPGYPGCLIARKRGVKHVYNALFEDFEFGAFGTDTVGLFDVVEHIEKDDIFLRQLGKKLNTGNKIVITVPAYNWLWSDLDDYGEHHRRYNKTMIYDLAARAGLRVSYFSYFFSYLVPLTWLVRALPYRIRGPRDKEQILAAENRQHKPGGIINSVFNSLGKLELSLMNKMPLPMGASIITTFEVI